MLGGYRPGRLGEVERDAVVGLDHEEVPEPAGLRQAENPSQEPRRQLLVTARDDRVVQLHAHPVIVPIVLASEKLVDRIAGWAFLRAALSLISQLQKNS